MKKYSCPKCKSVRVWFSTFQIIVTPKIKDKYSKYRHMPVYPNKNDIKYKRYKCARCGHEFNKAKKQEII
jgi:DNA-directed RNA polymerase subunit M/transcription elongation factor TFIIS